MKKKAAEENILWTLACMFYHKFVNLIFFNAADETNHFQV